MYNELKKEIIDMKYPTGRELRKKEFSDFVGKLKEATSFLDEVYEEVKPVTRCFVVINNIKEVPTCGYCGCYAPIGPNRYKTDHYYKNGFRAFCSRKCNAKGSIEKREKTCIKRYGSKHHMGSSEVRKKISDTNNTRYGASVYIASKEFQEKYKKEYEEKTGYSHHLANPDIIAKRENTNIENHGYKNSFQFSRDKIVQSMIKNHGVESPLQNDEIKAKVFETNRERYKYHSPMMNQEVQQKSKDTCMRIYKHKYASRAHYSEKANEYLYDRDKLQSLYDEVGNSHQIAKELGIGSHRTILQALREHDIEIKDHSDKRESEAEKQIRRFLEENGIEYIHNTYNIVPPKEIDIYIPDANVAIEYNGVYWHSDVYKDKWFHQEKSVGCMDKDILLIHVYEDQWVEPSTREIIKEKILQKCGQSNKQKVFARKCKVVDVEPVVARHFYLETHIQGYNDSKYNYGLEYNGELIACVSFKKKQGYNNTFDLVRYATKQNVVGGFSKLLKHFQRNVSWETIETFASLDYSHGGVYEKTGFENCGITEPNYYYFKGLTRFSRNKFMKHLLSDLLDNYDEELTEKENMSLHGYTLMYDSGSIKYKLSNK